MNRQHRKTWRAIVAVLVVIVLIGVFIERPTIVSRVVTVTPAQVAPVGPLRLEHVLSTSPGCSSIGYIPSGCIWHMTCISFVVQSAYAYEYALTGYNTTVGDYDYGSCHVQQRIYMAGGAWDRYTYYGIVPVVGSGCVELYAAPNGGRFALVHMDCGQIPLGAVKPATPGAIATPTPVAGGARLSGDELTALEVSRVLASSNYRLTPGRVVHGGQFLGYSRWPDWAIYGNGSYGSADAHLCLVLDQRARDWLLYVASGLDRPPKPKPTPRPKKTPFPVKSWGRLAHNDRHGHLLLIARLWLKHRSLGTYRDHATWHPGKKHAKNGYMDYRFQRGHLLYWPRYNRVKVTK